MITVRYSTMQHDLVCGLIRAFTWSEFSHVDVVMPNGKLLGARAKGGVSELNSDYEPKAKVAYYFIHGLTLTQEGLVYQFLQSQLGKPYDYGAVAGWLLHRDWQSPIKWYCSELVAAAFLYAGVPLLNLEKVNRIVPGLLMLAPYQVACDSAQQLSLKLSHSLSAH